MNSQSLQNEKLNLISWISQMEDENLIHRLKTIREENISIPKKQMEEVLRRIENTKPEEYKTWEEVKSELKLKP